MHRLWQCESVAHLRSAHVTPAMCDAALGSNDANHMLLYQRGLFPHPADLFPPPLTSGGIHFRNYSAPEGVSEAQLGFSGSVFVDGSCLRHPIHELS